MIPFMKICPQTILGRTLGVLLLGFLVIGGIMASQMYAERQALLTNIGGWHVVSRIAGVTQSLNEMDATDRPLALPSFQGPVFRVTHSAQSQIPASSLDWEGRLVKEALQSQLGDIADDDFRMGRALVDHRRNTSGMMARMHGNERTGPRRMMVISLKLSDGWWLNFATSPPPLQAALHSQIFWPGILLLLVVVVVSMWAVRRATQPLSLFAQAAERLGLDFNAPKLDERGPREVLRAAKAFNQMQDRLQAFVKDRTHMLAAISHDLRTPITRLKLRAEFIEDEEQRTKMLNDLDEMESMISSTLKFARDDAANELIEPLDFAQLVKNLTENLDVTCRLPDTLAFVGRPLGLKRLVGNLVGNAQGFGTKVEIELSEKDGCLELVVLDDGPGIPDDMIERVFDPFVRVENSRSRDTGGTGLGLVAVKMVAQAHGGTVELSNRKNGGLRATVRLPLS